VTAKAISSTQVSASATLGAAAVDTVTVTPAGTAVEVVNVDGAAAIWFSFDGSTPTVGGQNCAVLPAVIGSLVVTFPPGSPGVISLISAGTPVYAVQRASAT
jgi:hypothetical protein